MNSCSPSPLREAGAASEVEAVPGERIEMLKLLIDFLFPTHFTETLVAERNRRMKAVRMRKVERKKLAQDWRQERVSSL